MYMYMCIMYIHTSESLLSLPFDSIVCSSDRRHLCYHEQVDWSFCGYIDSTESKGKEEREDVHLYMENIDFIHFIHVLLNETKV